MKSLLIGTLVAFCLSCTIDAKSPQLAGYAADAGHALAADTATSAIAAGFAGDAGFANNAAYAADAGFAASAAFAIDAGSAANAAYAADAGLAANALALGGIAASQYQTAAVQDLKYVPRDSKGNVQLPEGARIVNTAGGVSYSVGGVYCGITTQTQGSLTAGQTNGNISDGNGHGQYVAAKKLCEAACNNNPAAHMCQASEMVRTAQMGIALTTGGWYSSGLLYPDSNQNNYDCRGWTDASSGNLASVWSVGPNLPEHDYCYSTHYILCCF